jgi:hypothetical protein
MRTGAFSLVETALRAGVEVCFANPGTTEGHGNKLFLGSRKVFSNSAKFITVATIFTAVIGLSLEFLI